MHEDRLKRENRMADALWDAIVAAAEYASQLILDGFVVSSQDWEAIESGIAIEMQEFFDETHAVASASVRAKLYGAILKGRMGRWRKLATDLVQKSSVRARALAQRVVGSIKEGLSGTVETTRSTAKSVVDAIRSGGTRMVNTIKRWFKWTPARARSNAVTEITSADTEARRATAETIKAEIQGPVVVEPETSPIGDKFAPPEIVLDDRLTMLRDFDIIEIWRNLPTSNVCPRCLAINGLREYDWPPEAVAGPPLHPNCNCFLDYEYA